MIKEILIVAGDDNTSLEFKYQKIMALLQDAKYDRLSD
jgi:prolyl-tRNA editing enzyme YbaK/EbsC (Cys-tRNA(Pro) deacylase)